MSQAGHVSINIPVHHLVVGDKVCTVLATNYENGGLAQYTVWQTRKSQTAETAAGLPLAGGWTVCNSTGMMVTVTCNAKATMPDGSSKANYLKSLSADETIDYKKVDPTTFLSGQGFDHILDAAGSVDD